MNPLGTPVAGTVQKSDIGLFAFERMGYFFEGYPPGPSDTPVWKIDVGQQAWNRRFLAKGMDGSPVLAANP
jgi:hypothetical protein